LPKSIIFGLVKFSRVRIFPTRKNCIFSLTGLKIVVGVGFCKIKVDSNFLLVLKIKCTKFHQDRSKTVDLHTKYTNKQTFSFIYIDFCIKKSRRQTMNKQWERRFLRSYPSKYYLHSALLNFSDQMIQTDVCSFAVIIFTNFPALFQHANVS
jgi:hypothetical protein